MALRAAGQRGQGSGGGGSPSARWGCGSSLVFLGRLRLLSREFAEDGTCRRRVGRQDDAAEVGASIGLSAAPCSREGVCLGDVRIQGPGATRSGAGASSLGYILIEEKAPSELVLPALRYTCGASRRVARGVPTRLYVVTRVATVDERLRRESSWIEAANSRRLKRSHGMAACSCGKLRPRHPL